MSEQSFGRGALAAGGLAANVASACCLGSLVLVALGFSGAWIGNLTALEPYRPVFISGALVALFLAYRRIYRPVAACKPGEVCVAPQARSAYIQGWINYYSANTAYVVRGLLKQQSYLAPGLVEAIVKPKAAKDCPVSVTLTEQEKTDLRNLASKAGGAH
jgi:mercuric ion transport protein